MNLKKRKHFTSRKEESFRMSLVLSCCFSFQTRTDLVRRFLKTFREFSAEQLSWKQFLGKFKLFKMDSGKGVFLSVFQAPSTVASKHWTETHFFEWQHCLLLIPQSHQRFVKKWKPFLFKCPKILRHETYSKRKLCVFSEMNSSQKNLLCKDQSSQNFLKSLVLG